MNDKIIIKGVPLIKTKTEARIKEFQAGCVYCKSLQYYIDLEKKQGDDVVGDAWEASVPLREADIYIPDENYAVHVNNIAIPTMVKDNFVFCMTGIIPQYKEHKLVEEELTKFGEASLLITNMVEFVNKIERAAIKKGFKMIKHGFVNYYDEKYDNLQMLLDIMYSTSNIAFWKRKKYANQSEYRFLFEGNTQNDFVKFDIGDISSISCYLTQKQLQKAMYKKTKK